MALAFGASISAAATSNAPTNRNRVSGCQQGLFETGHGHVVDKQVSVCIYVFLWLLLVSLFTALRAIFHTRSRRL
jgi:hypothetical protein